MDIQLSAPNFNATTITAKAVSPKAKAFFAEMYGPGAVSVNLKKSFGGDFIVYAEKKGMVVIA